MKWVLAAFLPVTLLTAAEPARPRILGVPHAAFFAKDVAKTRSYYKNFLGLEEFPSRTGIDGKSAGITFKINDRQYVELLPELQPASDRLSHIALETDDAQAMRLYLASHRINVPDRVTTDRNGNLSFDIKDPEGHTVQFLQYRPNGKQMKAKGKHMPKTRISRRLMHVGIIVTALNPEMKFYGEVLGFKEFWRGSSDGARLSWINLKVPDGEDYVELMLYKDAPAPTARGSAHHICLEVADIQASLSFVESQPQRKEYTRPLEVRIGRNRKRQLNLFDPDGTRTELMEPVTVDGVPAPPSQAPPPN